MTTQQVVTFMSGSVATRVESQSFWDAIRRLVTELGMTTQQLVTFMSNNSVAARVDSPEFFTCLEREWQLNPGISLTCLKSHLLHSVQPQRKRARSA